MDIGEDRDRCGDLEKGQEAPIAFYLYCTLAFTVALVPE